MKNILITGAAKGLGYALSKTFYENGDHLFLVVRKQKDKCRLQSELENVSIMNCDITSQNYNEKLAAFLKGETIDILINNAGSGSTGRNIELSTQEQLRQNVEVNCIAAFNTIKTSLENLKRSEYACIINISSRRGSLKLESEGHAKGSGCSISYRVSKAAQNMLTLCIAHELKESNIKIVAVHPGQLKTKKAPIDANMDPESSARLILQYISENELNVSGIHNMDGQLLPW
ncbi:hypothetical protein AB835_12580 [Candidatus Endobugula sertula]|uniref:Short-chain dehydrogenase n=1 Tax=Candidatus Endobugula sertula TaxID=62101 RepID=A0A1D2QMC3_9GAMM|nr:hypothetical protein AB835_12580 [Candidatus Endobugula sertula]